MIAGHSLGGAVAILCTLQLLQLGSPPAGEEKHVSCICFGTPALGNAALAEYVSASGWGDCFRSIMLPGVLSLLSMVLSIGGDS